MDALSQLLALFPVRARLVEKGAAAACPAASGTKTAGAVAFHFVLDGRVRVDVGAMGNVDLERGDLLLVAPGVPCRLQDDAAGMLELAQGHFLLPGGSSKVLADALPPAIFLNRTARDAHPALQGLLTVLSTEIRTMHLGCDAVVSHLLPGLFPLALRAWLGQAGPHTPGVLALAADRRLGVVLQAMLAEPARPWIIAQLAATSGMSRAQFARIFRDITGTTPAILLMKTRMVQAAAWLRAGHSTGHVAAAVGYLSEAAFNRVFKRNYGITPGSYRRHPGAFILD